MFKIAMAVGSFLLAFASGMAVAQFDENPAAPLSHNQASSLALFDVQIHSRDSATWGDNALEPMHNHHGPNCSGPPSTHPNNSYSGAVFVCNSHVMTAINASGYGMIALTPGQLLNCSQGCTVQWEMSTERQSTRDWPDVWLTPWNDNIALPFSREVGEVDLQGVPRQGLRLSAFAGQNSWSVATINNYAENVVPNLQNAGMHAGVNQGVNQSATRQTFKLTITPGHVRFERLPSSTATGMVWVDANAPVLLASDYVVQFAHHSYNPTKDGAGVPATWHWDEMKLSPSGQFGIIKTHTRALLQNGSVMFNAPAPANSWLRFSAVGSVQYSLNGGTTYQGAQRQAFLGHNEHASSYFIPIPSGTQTVQLKFSPDGWYQGPFVAQDFAIWTKPGPVPTAVQSPTRTPTPTGSTPFPPPTSTPTSAATPDAPVSWSTSASMAKPTVNRGDTQSITATARASQSRSALVDIEVYDGSGNKVWQSYQDNVAFSAGVTRTFPVAWAIPSSAGTGNYTVRIGIFSPGWGHLWSWNNEASRFTVR